MLGAAPGTGGFIKTRTEAQVNGWHWALPLSESVTSESASQRLTGAGSNQWPGDALQEAVTTQQKLPLTADVGQGESVWGIGSRWRFPRDVVMNPPIDQSNGVSAASISESYSEITQTAVQEASGEGVEWDQHAQQVAIVNQGGTASSSASQSNIDNLAHWTGTLATPPPGVLSGWRRLELRPGRRRTAC